MFWFKSYLNLSPSGFLGLLEQKTTGQVASHNKKSLEALECRRMKPGVGACWLLLKALGRISFMPLSYLLVVRTILGVPWPTDTSLHFLLPSVFPSAYLFEMTLLIAFRAPVNPEEFHSGILTLEKILFLHKILFTGS